MNAKNIYLLFLILKEKRNSSVRTRPHSFFITWAKRID